MIRFKIGVINENLRQKISFLNLATLCNTHWTSLDRVTPRSKLKTQLSKVGGPRRRSREKQKGRREERDRDRSIKQGDVGSTDRSQTILHWEKHRDARRREETTYTQWDPRRAESKSGELIVARAADEAATIRKPDL